MNEHFDFEKSMERLNEIISEIESESNSLDVSLGLYKEGMALAADCAEKLASVEKEVMMLSVNAEGNVEKRAFSPEADDEL